MFTSGIIMLTLKDNVVAEIVVSCADINRKFYVGTVSMRCWSDLGLAQTCHIDKATWANISWEIQGYSCSVE